MARKYSPSASEDVGKALHREKSRKQAIAIGLSEARAKGKKVPKKKMSKKKAS